MPGGVPGAGAQRDGLTLRAVLLPGAGAREPHGAAGLRAEHGLLPDLVLHAAHARRVFLLDVCLELRARALVHTKEINPNALRFPRNVDFKLYI